MYTSQFCFFYVVSNCCYDSKQFLVKLVNLSILPNDIVSRSQKTNGSLSFNIVWSYLATKLDDKELVVLHPVQMNPMMQTSTGPF